MLHSLFSDVPYRGLLAVENDFVELPSQIMENWATEPEMLRSYAIHWQTGKVIPENLIKRIQESALFNQGFETVELAAASYSDMELHDMEEYVPVDLDAFEKRVLNEERGLIPQIEPRYRYPYFSHIFDGAIRPAITVTSGRKCSIRMRMKPSGRRANCSTRRSLPGSVRRYSPKGGRKTAWCSMRISADVSPVGCLCSCRGDW